MKQAVCWKRTQGEKPSDKKYPPEVCKMILNIEPVQIERLFTFYQCVDDVIATVCNYYGLEFKLMYAYTWDFIYKSKEDAGGLELHERIDVSNVADRYQCLEACHGIKMEYHYSGDMDELFEIIKNELSHGRPAAIRYDSYYCPWDAWYNVGHTNHVCLAIGMDEAKDALHLIDPYNMVKDKTVTKEALASGSGFCITFAVDPGKNRNRPWRPVLKSVLSGMFANRGNTTAFDDMRAFAEDFRVQFSLAGHEENDRKRDLWRKLYPTLHYLIAGRGLFLINLKEIEEKENSPGFSSYMNSFRRMISKWTIIVTSMKRVFNTMNRPDSADQIYSTDIDRVVERIYNVLLEEADYEESVAAGLLEVIASGGRKNDPVPGTPKKTGSLRDRVGYLPVKLAEHFNNKAFGSGKDVYTPNFTGYYDYFLIENIPEDRPWVVDGVTYMFPVICTDRPDNISCFGQNIALPRVRCCSIRFLACAECGNYYETLKVKYEKGEEMINFSISDFVGKKLFEEKTVWSGRLGCTAEHQIKVVQNNAAIFEYSYALDNGQPIESITLPFCPNVHIFAISLGVIDVAEEEKTG